MQSELKKGTPVIKVILVGDSGVGKSALLNKYVDGEFNDSHLATIGIEFKTKQTKFAKLQIWDTAGQEKFRKIIIAYFRAAPICLFIFDVTNEESFKSISNYLQLQKEHGIAGTELMLVANKIDLADKRMVSSEQAEEFALKNNMMYFECSSKELNTAEFEAKLEEICNKCLYNAEANKVDIKYI